MALTSQDVTEAELAVLLPALGDEGRRSIRAVGRGRVPAGRDVGVCARCRSSRIGSRPRGSCTRDRGGAVHAFRAAVERDELIGRRLRAVADTLCGGSLTPLLSHLVQGRRLSDQERQALRALVEQLDREA